MQTSHSFLFPLISIVLSFTILTLPAYAAYTPTLSDQTCAPGAVAVITSNGLECKLAGDILAQGVTVNSGTLASCSDDELLWTDNGQIKCVNLNCPKTSDPGTHKYLAGFKDGASECLSVPLGSSSNWTVSGSYNPNAIPVNDSLSAVDDGDMSYLVIHGTGNYGIITSWFEHIYTQAGKDQINRAIAGNNILFVSTWEYENGRYVRRYSSDLCVGVDEACLWVWGTQPQLGTGVSGATAHLSASIASVLAVFPDTAYQDLSKITKACAKKRGEGIEELLREFGGFGVADFGCMDEITTAARALPAGGTTTVDIDGKTVRVSERMLVVE